MASRSLMDLHPDCKVKALKFLKLCADNGLPVLIYCTYRQNEEQQKLYDQGRTTQGPACKCKKPCKKHPKGLTVTGCKPGASKHNYVLPGGRPAGKAFDACPIGPKGECLWDDAEKFQKMGRLGKEAGLNWGGDWRSKDSPHFEIEDGGK